MRKPKSSQRTSAQIKPRLRIDILSIFPEIFKGYLESGLMSKAIKNGLLTCNVYNIRDWTKDRHKTTDDKPYGGGPGMILKPEPIASALMELKNEESRTILLSPRGEKLNQKKARRLADQKHLILICGHYEGVDQRIVDYYVDEELSIGDYILSGGEPAAIVVIDAVSRLVPGFLGNKHSLDKESFEGKLLEFPQYTRPRKFNGLKVPEILLKGNHQKIEAWRERKALKITKQVRPDLLTALKG